MTRQTHGVFNSFGILVALSKPFGPKHQFLRIKILSHTLMCLQMKTNILSVPCKKSLQNNSTFCIDTVFLIQKPNYLLSQIQNCSWFKSKDYIVHKTVQKGASSKSMESPYKTTFPSMAMTRKSRVPKTTYWQRNKIDQHLNLPNNL